MNYELAARLRQILTETRRSEVCLGLRSKKSPNLFKQSCAVFLEDIIQILYNIDTKEKKYVCYHFEKIVMRIKLKRLCKVKLHDDIATSTNSCDLSTITRKPAHCGGMRWIHLSLFFTQHHSVPRGGDICFHH